MPDAPANGETKRKIGRPSKLDDHTHNGIVQAIRAGSYEWVAAVAFGIAAQTFRKWMRKGEDDPASDYGAFRAEVLEARAQARLAAETEVRKADPKFWLRCGPGKEKPGEPGWTDSLALTGADGGPVTLAAALVELAAQDTLPVPAHAVVLDAPKPKRKRRANGKGNGRANGRAKGNGRAKRKPRGKGNGKP